MVKLLLVALLVLAAASARTLADEPLTRETSLHFATVEEGQGLVATSDTFIKTLSRFDRQVRLKTAGEATEAALIEFLKGEVVEWDDAARKSLVESIERLRPKLEPFHLPLPRAVLLIQMS
ncbi:MAG: hypothetical protein AABP62_27200, partial [Planctomycetota bacterium]